MYSIDILLTIWTFVIIALLATYALTAAGPTVGERIESMRPPRRG